VCVLYSDRHGKTAVDLAWHPVMKEALQTPVSDNSLNKVLSYLHLQTYFSDLFLTVHQY